MVPPVPHDSDPPLPSSMWRELVDGTAGRAVRAIATVAVLVFLTGLVPIVAYFLAALNSGWNRGSAGVYPEDGLIIFLIVVASAAFLLAVVWLWARPARRKVLWQPTAKTIAVGAFTVCAGIFIDSRFSGASELVVFGLALVALSAIIVVWAEAIRRHRLGRPVVNAIDGLIDLRCPSCGYRMVGLTESRCPECGTAYTLDELLAKQQFRGTTPPPPVPAPASGAAVPQDGSYAISARSASSTVS